MESLEHLEKLYLALARKLDVSLPVRSAGIGVAPNVFDSAARYIDSLAVTSEAAEFIDKQPSDAASCQWSEMDCEWEPKEAVSEPKDQYRKSLIGRLTKSQMTDVSVVRQLLGGTSDGAIGGASKLRKPLFLEGIERLEVEFGQHYTLKSHKKYQRC